MDWTSQRYFVIPPPHPQQPFHTQKFPPQLSSRHSAHFLPPSPFSFFAFLWWAAGRGGRAQPVAESSRFSQVQWALLRQHQNVEQVGPCGTTAKIVSTTRTQNVLFDKRVLRNSIFKRKSKANVILAIHRWMDNLLVIEPVQRFHVRSKRFFQLEIINIKTRTPTDLLYLFRELFLPEVFSDRLFIAEPLRMLPQMPPALLGQSPLL